MEREIKKTSSKGLVSDSNKYKTEKGEISMLTPCRATCNFYEIYCCEGGLFDDIERYGTLSEAKERINELLN